MHSDQPSTFSYFHEGKLMLTLLTGFIFMCFSQSIPFSRTLEHSVSIVFTLDTSKGNLVRSKFKFTISKPIFEGILLTELAKENVKSIIDNIISILATSLSATGMGFLFLTM